MEKETTSERTSARKKEGMRLTPHQRLWWTEFVRGLVAFAFGLLFLMAGSFAPRLFMYSLGVYLVIDGVLELSDVYRRKGISQTTTRDSAGGAMSLLTGLFSLIFPTVSLLLLAGILALRLLIRSMSQMRTARRTGGSSTALLWLSSGLFVLLGLFLLLFPLLAMTFLVIFLGSYMVGAGLFLLLRGLSLHSRPNSLSASPSPSPQTSTGLSKGLLSSTRRAIVFVRRTAADGLGHIAWGFEWRNGWFNVGSVENSKGKPFADPANMGFWSTRTQDPLTTIQKQDYPYDEYKLFFVMQPHPKAAWKTVIWESQQPYAFVHHNCCDVTYEILRAYGCTQMLDPAKEYIPNDWYDALPGTSYPIAAPPAIPLIPHKRSRRKIAPREIALAIPLRMKGSPPPHGIYRWRTGEELTLVWEMMIGHLLTLWTSGLKFITQYWRRHAPHP